MSRARSQETLVSEEQAFLARGEISFMYEENGRLISFDVCSEIPFGRVLPTHWMCPLGSETWRRRFMLVVLSTRCLLSA